MQLPGAVLVPAGMVPLPGVPHPQVIHRARGAPPRLSSCRGRTHPPGPPPAYQSHCTAPRHRQATPPRNLLPATLIPDTPYTTPAAGPHVTESSNLPRVGGPRRVQSVHRLTRVRDIGESPPDNLHAAFNSQLYNT